MLQSNNNKKLEVLNLVKGLTPRQVVRYDFDKLAFGFSEGERVTVKISELVTSEDDMENVTGVDMKKYFRGKTYSKLEKKHPIEVEYREDHKFHVVDGHHRYGLAVQEGLKKVQVLVTRVKANPITALGFKDVDEVISLSKK